MTTETEIGRIDSLLGKLLDIGEADGDRLTVTATLDLTPDGTGQPPVLKALRQAGRQAAEGLEKHQAEAVEDEMRELEEAAADASSRGVLGLVWVAHPVYSGDAQDADPNPGPFVVLELAAPIRNSVRAGSGPRVFEVARAAYLDRPVALVTTDMHTMDVTRVRYGAAAGSDEVDWPQHYTSKLGQRTNRAAQGGPVGGMQGTGHAYANVERWVEAQRNLFANEAAEHVAKFVHGDDILVVEGVDEARSQLLGRLPESVSARAVQLNAPPHGEDDRDRFDRLRRLAIDVQLDNGRQRAEGWFGGAEPNAINGLEAIATACEQGRVATVIVHEDATDHLGTAEDTRVHESSVDGAAVERLLQAALRQGAVAVFTDDERLLGEGGIVAIGRY